MILYLYGFSPPFLEIHNPPGRTEPPEPSSVTYHRLGRIIFIAVIVDFVVIIMVILIFLINHPHQFHHREYLSNHYVNYAANTITKRATPF